MQVIKKAVRPEPKSVPLIFYKTHSQDFIDQLPVELINNPMFNLRERIVIDRRWSQRLINAWEEAKAKGYIKDVYSGYNQIDAFVLICLKEIKRVLREGVDMVGHIAKKQMVGVEYGLGIIEGLIGKDHKELKPLRQIMTEFGWDNYEALDVEDKRTWWQLVQKILGGTGHTKDEAKKWQDLRGKRGRRRRSKARQYGP